MITIGENAPREIVVLSLPKDVEPFVETVRVAADSNTKALGFLKSVVYPTSARKGNLFVAVDSGNRAYLGHLLFSVRFPHATVLQLFAEPSHRGRGVSSKLLEKLKEYLQQLGYLSIRAQVAEDLEANSFWARKGFAVTGVKMGGVTTGRKLLIRVLELASQQLFETSGITGDGAGSLGLPEISRPPDSLYLLDLNVIFDVSTRRSRHEAAAQVLRFAHVGDYRIAISDEAGVELRRASADRQSDQMIGVLETIPKIVLPRTAETDQLVVRVAGLIFPQKSFPRGLSKNDMSDCKHVATAIAHQASGFITADGKILGAAPKLLREFGLNVLTVEEITDPLWSQEAPIEVDFGRSLEFSIHPYLDADRLEVKAFLERQGVKCEEIESAWIPRLSGGLMASRVVARESGGVIGYATWTKPVRESHRAFINIAVDDAVASAAALADSLVSMSVGECCRDSLGSLDLTVPPRHFQLKQVAQQCGFHSEKSTSLRKISVPNIVGPRGWASISCAISHAEGVTLPDSLPEWRKFREFKPVIGADGQRRHISFSDLEMRLSPLLLVASGRPAVLVPIQRRYRERLLGDPHQMTLGPRLQAELSWQRLYLADPTTARRFAIGGLVFFYEPLDGGGSGSVLAVAKIANAFLIRRDSGLVSSLSKSVLTAETLDEIGASEEKAACLFESLQWLRFPVSLKALRKSGIKNGQLVTTLTLKDTVLGNLLAEARIE